MKTDDRERKPLPVSTAMHTCVHVCMLSESIRNAAPYMCLDELHPILTCPTTTYFVFLLSFGCESNRDCLFLDGGLAGTRDNYTLNENLQPELHPTRATSQPNMQPRVQPPKGECVIVCNWLLPPLIRAPTANGINTVISHCVLNKPCYLPCLTQVLSLPASTPLCFSLVQAAQMPWHFGNVKQILAR